MGLDISSARIETTSSSFTIKDTSGTSLLTRGVSTYNAQNYAYFNNSGVPGFIAGRVSDPAAWINPGASGTWSKINNYCTDTTYNRGSAYNTSTTRFTAPITGPYWFSFTTYLYTDSYVHPIFSVNGSLNTGFATQYRIRAHGMVANYQQDAQIEEVVYLTAGNYVEVYWYNSGTCYHYPYYSLFQGVYVG